MPSDSLSFNRVFAGRLTSKQARGKRDKRLLLENLEIRTMLSSDPSLPGISAPDHNEVSVALVAPQNQVTAVPVASAVGVGAGAAPAGYNANDWAKVTAAGINKYVSWLSNGSEMRLWSINISGCSLRGTLDLSGCTTLQYLDCNDNQLTSLNVSGCIALRNLGCTYNQLTSLDVSDYTALQILYCSDNQLTTLKAPGCTALTTLTCDNNQLTELDVSGDTALPTLDCSNQKLGSTAYGDVVSPLNVSGCTALTTLDCSNNQLTSGGRYLAPLDLSECTALQTLNCSNNLMTELDLYDCQNLTNLDCSNNKLTSITFYWQSPPLQTVDCSNNQIDILNFGGSDKLETLDCHSNVLTWLILKQSYDATLKTLDCHDNKLPSLDLLGCTALQTLDCQNNKLPTLNASSCTALQTLSCQNNQMTSLNTSGCKNLQTLSCQNNKLPSLNVSNCKDLQTLSCQGNQLTSLNVSSCTALQTLSCQNNKLISLDVFYCKDLDSLDCSSNQLTFSTLPWTNANNYIYSPQNNVSIVSSLSPGATLNLSKDAVIYDPLMPNVYTWPTAYMWYYADGTVVSKDDYTETNGQFVFGGLNNGDVIYCMMTNARFPKLGLQTTQVTIQASASATSTVNVVPLSVKATADGMSAIVISWKAPKATSVPSGYEVVGYNIYDSVGNLISTAAADDTSFRVADLPTPNTAYTFKIVAVCQPIGGGEAVESSKAVVVKGKTTAFLAPKLVKAVAGDVSYTSITIRWQANADADGFNVNCLLNKTVVPLDFGDGGNASYLYDNGKIVGVTITGLSAGAKYSFTVSGKNSVLDVESAMLKVSVATLKFPVTKAPTLVKGQVMADSAALTWKETVLPKGVEGSVGYERYYTETKGLKPGQSGWTLLPGTVFTGGTSATITGLEPGRIYYVYVRSIWSEDANAFSDSGVLQVKMVSVR
ncbi:MAG: leucine-rich repeat domain-containing protein [Phycisphaerales bacterium]|nr:leucine-rich repeat domain-containing protein [Phycisphaerales bacterium]